MVHKSEKGMTMIEILVVIAILTILFAVGLFMSMTAYHGYSRRSDRDTLVSMLQRARSSAMANINQHQWGVCRDTTIPSAPTYILFSGPNFQNAYPTKITVPSNPGATVTDVSSPLILGCGAGGIVFTQLTGDTVATSVTITEAGATSNVSTNVEGGIIW